MAFLLGTKPETKRVKSIIKEAELIKADCAKPKRVFNQPVDEAQDLDIIKTEEKKEPEPVEEENIKQTTLF